MKQTAGWVRGWGVVLLLLISLLQSAAGRATANVFPASVVRMATQVEGSKHILDTQFDGAISVATADMDNDQDFDIIAAARNLNSVVWWENDGWGYFSKHIVDSNFTSVRGIATGDLDGDGYQDILGGAYETHEVAWWVNDRHGSFTKRIIDTDFLYAGSVASADLDQDGDVDVIAGGHDSGLLAWYQNDGFGNFTKHVFSPDDLSCIYDIHAADVTGDNLVDVMVASYPFKIYLFRSTGGGNFQTGLPIEETFVGASSVYSGDMNSDGKVDILSSAMHAAYFLYTRNVSGDFTYKGDYTIGSGYSGARSIKAFDMDGDGDMDAAGAVRYDGKVLWFENLGPMTFAPHVLDDNIAGAMSISIADLNGDGRPDIVGAASESNTLAWWELGEDTTPPAAVDDLLARPGKFEDSIALRWTAPGDDETIGRAANYVIRYSSRPIVTMEDWGNAADLPGEPPPQLAGTTETMLVRGFPIPSRFYFAIRTQDEMLNISDLSNSSGSDTWINRFFPHTVLPDDPTPVRVSAVDFDFDQDADLLIYDDTTGMLHLLDNQGHGNFEDHSLVWAFRMNDMAAGDFDNDGAAEIVLSHSGARTNMKKEINGEYVSWWIDDSITSVYGLGVVDLDQDGDLDIFGSSADDKTIWWWENYWMVFTPHPVAVNVPASQDLRAVDLDGDLDYDLVGLIDEDEDNRFIWWENNGSQQFTEHTISHYFWTPTSIFPADMDNDGDIDIMGTGYYENSIIVFENDGDQNFSIRTISNTNHWSRSAVAADLDGDGDLDIVSASQKDETISWWEQHSPWDFSEHLIAENTPVSFCCGELIVADFDRSGIADITIAGRNRLGLVWWQNRMSWDSLHLPIIRR